MRPYTYLHCEAECAQQEIQSGPSWPNPKTFFRASRRPQRWAFGFDVALSAIQFGSFAVGTMDDALPHVIMHVGTLTIRRERPSWTSNLQVADSSGDTCSCVAGREEVPCT